jgi:hypothetical protein
MPLENRSPLMVSKEISKCLQTCRVCAFFFMKQEGASPGACAKLLEDSTLISSIPNYKMF